MKKLIILIIAACFSFQAHAQQLNAADSRQIDQKVNAFLGMIGQKNYTGLIDYMYPKIFEHTSKQEMFQLFELVEKAGIELQFKNMEVLESTALNSESDINYAMIKYNLDMVLPLNTDELKGYAGLLVPTLQSNFGKENVTYNRSESYIEVKGQKYLMGVKDPAFDNDWLFLIFDASFRSAIDKTIPAAINKQAAAIAY